MSRLPLKGVRVVDITWAWAGPMCSLQLVHFGAEVIKVESRTHLDLTRTGARLAPGTSPNVRWNFNMFNQGKRSFTVNFGTREGPELVRRLVSVSDVLVENMTPGVLERAGLGYQRLREVRPDLVMASLSGFGATGPMSRYPAFGVPLVFMSGLASLTGYPGGGPRSVGVSYPDPNAGLHGAFAILSALRHRARTGEGQYIDLSELELTIAVLPEGFLPVTTGGEAPPRNGNRDVQWAPHGCYRCAGEDDWVAIAVRSDDEWLRLAQVMGRSDLAAAERFRTQASRKANEDELDQAVTAWTAALDRWAVTSLLQDAGIAAFPTLSVADLARDRQLEARGFFATPEHPELPGKRHPGIPWHMSRTNDRVLKPSPQLGEANSYLLEELFGFSGDRVGRLQDDGVLT